MLQGVIPGVVCFENTDTRQKLRAVPDTVLGSHPAICIAWIVYVEPIVEVATG
jgi:hypothetical protein